MTNEFSNDFGIGGTRKDVSQGLEFPAKFTGIVESAIVHQCECSTGIHVRMRVGVCFSSVSGPTGVRNASGMSHGSS